MALFRRYLDSLKTYDGAEGRFEVDHVISIRISSTLSFYGYNPGNIEDLVPSVPTVCRIKERSQFQQNFGC